MHVIIHELENYPLVSEMNHYSHSLQSTIQTPRLVSLNQNSLELCVVRTLLLSITQMQ
jgi:hypothetical protein